MKAEIISIGSELTSGQNLPIEMISIVSELTSGPVAQPPAGRDRHPGRLPHHRRRRPGR